MTIGWIEISKKKYGGILYNQEARDALAKKFNVEAAICEPKYFRAIRYLRIPEPLFYLARLKGEKDLWIRDFYSVLTLPFDRTRGKNLANIPHIDFSSFPLISRPAFFLLKKIFYHNLKKVDAIVTISEYWKNHFEKRGFSNVYKIYNGFDLSKFEISDQESEDFKKQFHLEGKPIIYIGNCQRAKGVVESYEALKDLDVHLVTSGKRQVKISAVNLDLEHRDYLRLLKASSVVVTMSKFLEGWCRTTHEAMLVKTPVVGSGKGGMRELLEGGGQIVCEDFSQLRGHVRYALMHPEIGERGYQFARDFTLERFQQEWIALIKRL